jgi:polyhydroxybutyrate depolymerase
VQQATKTMLVLAAALVVVASACSSGGDESGDAPGDDPASATGVGAEPAPPVPSPGCEAGATAQADQAEVTLTVRDAERRYLISAPAREPGDEPLPLVLDFHGLAEGADVHAGMTQLGPLGIEEGFVTVFPHGRGQPVAWDIGTDPETNDDLAYVTAVLDRVEEERCVDTARIYATGLSNGAMMSSAVACAMAGRVAAVAPIAGIALPDPCEPERPVPVLTIHGTADPILLFNGGVGTGALDAALGGEASATTTTTAAADLDGPGYPETVRGWAELDGCETTATDERVSDEVIRRTYDCPEDAPVEFLIVEGGGHSWPSSEFSRSIESFVGPTTFDIDASREAWDFVSRFHLPAS